MANSDNPQPLVSANLSSLAFERLEQAIMSGELKPGERLSETTLAKRYGISRGPLREAIGRLEGRNLRPPRATPTAPPPPARDSGG